MVANITTVALNANYDAFIKSNRQARRLDRNIRKLVVHQKKVDSGFDSKHRPLSTTRQKQLQDFYKGEIASERARENETIFLKR